MSVEFVHEVGARLRAHVRMEERELFPYLEGALAATTLQKLGAQLSHGPDDCAADVARRFLDALISGEIERLVALADPAIELYPLRLTRTPAYRGHNGIHRWRADLEQQAAHISFDVEEVRAVDDQHASARLQLHAGGQALATVTAVFTITRGKVSEVHGYLSDEDLLSEVGHI
jgi:hypothetical protein